MGQSALSLASRRLVCLTRLDIAQSGGRPTQRSIRTYATVTAQVAWKTASQRTEELDTTKEVAISTTERKQWMDNFRKKHGFALPASRTPHDTTLGTIKRQLDSEQLAYLPLQKVKIFGKFIVFVDF